MGKKAKTGKARKDKFYQLAKETGYRSRAAFKLLQLNRKYEFLQKSRVCVDLCAAPGGWAQVAAQHMPISSVIIAIDLVSIRPIHNVTTLQEDITTEKCRQALRKELQTWKADVFLNDGAPNIGQNWLFDAFAQIQLTLQAMRLATMFLKKGGWFVTKVFRSKDYHALLWVFNQLFHKVHATKPQASRNESAEIFVVCQGYLAPDRLDPKFTDPKYVFKEVDMDPKNALNLIHPEKTKKKKAEGYAEGDYTLHHKLTMTDYMNSENHMEVLALASQIIIDDPRVEKHELTTDEIKECCKDIKVLAKKELKRLIVWRNKMKSYIESQETKPDGSNVEEIDESSSEDEDDKIERQVAEIKDEERRELKQKRKKVQKEKRKLRDKMSLSMVIPGDKINVNDDVNLFELKQVKSDKEMSEVDLADRIDTSESEEEPENKKTRVMYDRHDKNNMDDDGLSPDEESEEELEDVDMESDEDEKSALKNPLLVDFEKKDVKTKRKIDLWFSKDIFSGLGGDKEEDYEIEQMKEEYKRKGGVVLEKTKQESKAKEKPSNLKKELGLGKEEKTFRKSKVKERQSKKKEFNIKKEDSDAGNVSKSSGANATANDGVDWTELDPKNFQDPGRMSGESGSDASDDDNNNDKSEEEDDESDYDFSDIKKEISGKTQSEKNTDSKKDSFEIVPATEPVVKKVKLNPVELAIGAEMIKSAKRKRELIEDSFNRYTFNDDDLPDWFVKDEQKHYHRQLPVTKQQVQEYRERQKAIDARPIKKLAEAKARKKRKAMNKLEKVRQRANAISDTVDVTDREKWQKIKSIYKKAGLLKNKKENVTYVVAKKGTGKRVRRPTGVKGRFKVVDPRMKKDLRSMKNKEKTKGRSKKTPNKTPKKTPKAKR